MVVGAENGSRILLARCRTSIGNESAGFGTRSERVDDAYNDAMASLIGWQVHARLLVVAVMVATGCSEPGSEGAPGDVPCTPLAAEPAQPIALGTVLAIGRHADATIYVLDETSTGYRVFASAFGLRFSDPLTLRRKEISGSGSGVQ